MISSIAVFCGSSRGADPAYGKAAEAIGRAVARRGMTLVYGGGSLGLMGTMARSAMSEGGKVVGVIPRSIAERIADIELTERHVVEDMHARKSLMYRMAEGFIALPGGFGTFEEFFEAFTWYQLGYHLKPLGLLNVSGFYDGLVSFLRQAADAGFVRQAHLDALFVDSDPESLLDGISDARVTYVEKLHE